MRNDIGLCVEMKIHEQHSYAFGAESLCGFRGAADSFVGSMESYTFRREVLEL